MQLLKNNFKDQSFKNTAKHAENLSFNTLRDKANELDFKELDVNKSSFKVAVGKLQAKLKKKGGGLYLEIPYTNDRQKVSQKYIMKMGTCKQNTIFKR